MDSLAPWLPVVVGAAAAVAVIAAIAKGMMTAYRYLRRRSQERRTGRIVAIVTPLLDKRFQVVDSAMLSLRIEIGETRKAVDEVKRIVSNGLTEDVAEIRKAQHKVAGRIDKIYNHLID